MRYYFKWLKLAPLLFLYLVVAGAVRALPATASARRVMAMRTTSFFARILLLLLGVRVHVKHRERFHAGGRLVVANHLSYIDVLVLSSLLPSAFITSVELRSTVLLGTLARLGGSFFVERRRPSGLKREIAAIAAALGRKIPVVLFPEGTTSNGDRVRPFKNSLFDAAVSARVDLFPVCLRYLRINDGPVTHVNRDLAFYYGGVSFFRHFSRFLALRSVDVEVVPLAAVRTRGRSRKDLAGLAHDAVSTAYHA